MKKLIILLLIFNCKQFSFCIAQQKNETPLIDSLVGELPKVKEDSQKVKMLTDLSFLYYSLNPDDGLKYGKQGLELAEKLNWKKGIANGYHNMAINYSVKSLYPKALEYFLNSLKINEQLKDSKGTASDLCNIGIVYRRLADFPKALEYYLRALKIDEVSGDKTGMAYDYSNIGNIYLELRDFNKALEYYNKALKLKKEFDDKGGVSRVLCSIGVVYMEQSICSTALDYFFKSLEISEELKNKKGIAQNFGNIGATYNIQKDYTNALEYHWKTIKILDELGDKNGLASTFGAVGDSYFSMANDSNSFHLNKIFDGNKTRALQAAKFYIDSAIVMEIEIGDLNSLLKLYKQLSDIKSLQGDNKGALENYKNYTTLKDSVFNIEKDKKLTQTGMQYEFDKKEAATKAEQEKKDIQQSNIRNSITAGLAGALIFLLVVFSQRNKIKAGKKRSDELLLNILPEEVAEELKAKGSADAKQFDDVTVMFTDFKNFTQISEKLSPTELVNEIHTCFKAFDEIISYHNIEKIKTMGDSYMCAGGLPVANKTNATDVVSAAIEIQTFMQLHSSQRKNDGKEIFEIRIGIHTGPVVAGIVGVKKFAYDIWGDTVNIASRMESSGEAGKVNISGSTYELVKDKFTCTHRGKIQAKNKGEIDMYFVVSPQAME